ncbi:MAG TPA: hypothetical protein VFF06_25010 [Polyangia bacterium]|nr:hypothetical protein [Polyangia bacterium]
MWAICGAGLLALAGAGCGGNGLNGPEDMLPSHPLDDGHLSGCSADDDCNDGNKCHTYHCNIVTHACANTDVQCSSTDPCNTSACDPSSGTCALMGANDGATCTDPTSGSDGTCLAGTCKPLPNCDNSQNTFLSLQCSNDSLRYDDNNNDPNGGFFDATNQTSDYSCAKGETSGEVGYPFFTTVGGPVTVTLHVTNPNDPASPDMAGADPDLDLIILDGACTEKAACMNPAIAGGGFQGITAGTGTETVTFTAAANHNYFIVVDGKAGAVADYHVEVVACGNCQPKPSTTLACGMSVAVSGDTSTGMSTLSSYMCTDSAGTMSTVMAPGNEQVFMFNTVAPQVQNVKATVTAASGPFDIFALPNDLNGQCDPTACVGSTVVATASNGTGSLTFAADPGFSASSSYWVVVDTPTAGANATFGLQFDCLPYCTNDSFTDVLTCDSPTTRQVSGNNGNTGSTNQNTAWGPNPTTAPCSGLSNLDGPEYVYLFNTPAITNPSAQYTVSLASTDATHPPLSLIILKAGSTAPTSCDPQLACANTTGTYTTNGTTPANVTLTADGAGTNYYYIAVDGPSTSVGGFALNITGVDSTAICP